MTDEERDRLITEKLNAGMSLSAVQNLLSAEHGIRLSYLELRLIAVRLRGHSKGAAPTTTGTPAAPAVRDAGGRARRFAPGGSRPIRPGPGRRWIVAVVAAAFVVPLAVWWGRARNPEILADRAWEKLAAGKVEQAEVGFRRALARRPAMYAAEEGLGLALLQRLPPPVQDREMAEDGYRLVPAEAKEHLDRSVELAPDAERERQRQRLARRYEESKLYDGDLLDSAVARRGIEVQTEGAGCGTSIRVHARLVRPGGAFVRLVARPTVVRSGKDGVQALLVMERSFVVVGGLAPQTIELATVCVQPGLRCPAEGPLACTFERPATYFAGKTTELRALMSLRTLPATDADERLVRQLAANALLGFSREQELDRYVADNLSTEVARLKGRLPSDEASLLSQSDLEADVSRVLRSAFTEQAVRVGTTLAELSETMSSRDAELSALLERLRGEWAKPL